MKLEESRKMFVAEWGKLGSAWGVNRTMAQIHALLLAQNDVLDADEIMERLLISRGNASANLRTLLDWGLIHKVVRPGVRREFFVAEKNVWKVARIIAAERRKKELDPLVRFLDGAMIVEEGGGASRVEIREYQKTLREIRNFATRAGRILDLVQRLDQSAFFVRLAGLLKAG